MVYTKRWSNLISDFKKIKKWESWRENASYWMMRSDLRREQNLPGFFDREVYDVMDGKEYMRAADQLALVITSVDGNNGDDLDGLEIEDEDEMVEDEDVGNGSFIEFEQVAQERVQIDGKTTMIPSPVPISEMKYQPFHRADSNQGTARKRQAAPYFGTSPEFQDIYKYKEFHGQRKSTNYSLSNCKRVEKGTEEEFPEIM